MLHLHFRILELGILIKKIGCSAKLIPIVCNIPQNAHGLNRKPQIGFIRENLRYL